MVNRHRRRKPSEKAEDVLLIGRDTNFKQMGTKTRHKNGERRSAPGSSHQRVERHAVMCDDTLFSFQMVKLKGWFDGGAKPNPGEGGAGFYLSNGAHGYVYLGKTTNNVAEYAGIISLLKLATEVEDLEELTVYGDSQLVVRQYSGENACRNSKLIPLLQRVRELVDQLDLPKGNFRLIHIPRSENARADALATTGRDTKSSKVFRRHSDASK